MVRWVYIYQNSWSIGRLFIGEGWFFGGVVLGGTSEKKTVFLCKNKKK